MTEAKITITAQDLASAVLDAVNQKLRETGEAAKTSSEKGSALKKFVDDLTPSADNAHHSFTDLKGTLTEMWENPTGQVKALAGAAADDLAPALGSVGIAAAGALAMVTVLSAAAFELAEHAAEAGEHIYELSVKTGMSAPAISRLSQALTVVGGDLDHVGNAMFAFQKNVGENSDKVAEGLSKVGLRLSDIKKLEPDQQFLTMAEAISKAEDPIVRNSAAAAIFGQRLARDLMPTLLEVNDGLTKTAGMDVFTDAQAKEAQEFEDEVRLVKLQVGQLAISFGKELLPAVHDVLTFIQERKADLIDFVAQWNGIKFSYVVEGFKFIRAAIDDLRGSGGELPLTLEQIDAQTKKLHDSNAKAVGSIGPLTDGLKDEKEIVRGLNEDLKTQWKAADDAARAAKEWAGILRELQSSGGTWRETLEGIDGETVSAVEYYLSAGVAQGVLAKAYDLTTTQVHAISEAMKSEQEFLKRLDSDQQKFIQTNQLTSAELSKLGFVVVSMTSDTEAAFNRMGMKTTIDLNKLASQAVKDYDLIRDSGMATPREIEEAHAKMVAAVEASDSSATGALIANAKSAGFISRGQLQETADKAKILYGEMKESGLFTASEIQAAWEKANDAQQIALGKTKQAHVDGNTVILESASTMLETLGHKHKAAAIAGAIIDTYLSIAKSLASLPWPFNLVSAAAAAVVGWENVHRIESSDAGGYAGGGVADAVTFRAMGSDTVPAMLTPGEGILTADTTRRLGGAPAIDHLNRGGVIADQSGMHTRLDALHEQIRGLRADLGRMLDVQPIRLRHALRGAR